MSPLKGILGSTVWDKILQVPIWGIPFCEEKYMRVVQMDILLPHHHTPSPKKYLETFLIDHNFLTKMWKSTKTCFGVEKDKNNNDKQ